MDLLLVRVHDWVHCGSPQMGAEMPDRDGLVLVWFLTQAPCATLRHSISGKAFCNPSALLRW